MCARPNKSKSKKQRNAKAARRDNSAAASDANPSVDSVRIALVTGWMICGLMTLVCQVAAWLAVWRLEAADPDSFLAAFAAVLSFAALVLGALGLLMGPLVWRWANPRPPQSLMVWSVAIGLLPWLTLLVRAIGAR